MSKSNVYDPTPRLYITMEAGATQYIVNIHVLSGIFEMPGEFDSIAYTCLDRITVNYYAH